MGGRHHRLPHDPADAELLEADPLCDLQHPPKSSTPITRPIAAVLSDPIADRQLRKTIKHIENCSLTVNSNKQQSLQNLIPPAPPPPAPDKTAIKDAIKAGEEVPGAHIEVRQSLQIK